jgi:hypothetical protein
MMVAYDSRRPPTPLSEPTREMLRSAIRTALSARDESATALRPAVQTVAAEARERAMRPEELIIELKGIFTEALQGQKKSPGNDEHRVREWLVTNCLKAYYERPPEAP